MSDDIDRGQARELADREWLLQAARLPENAKSEPFCLDCGEAIEPARQRAAKGCTRCIVCQQIFEREFCR